MTEAQELKRVIHRFHRVRRAVSKDETMDIVRSMELSKDALGSMTNVVDDTFRRNSLVNSDSIVSRVSVALVLRGENLHVW